MIQLLLNKIMPHFQLLPMSKVDQFLLRINEVPPLQYPESHIIPVTTVDQTCPSSIKGEYLTCQSYYFTCFQRVSNKSSFCSIKLDNVIIFM